MKRIELSLLTKNVLRLPRLPVPSLDHTFDRYRESICALRPADSEEVRSHLQKLNEFASQSAPSIQKNILAKDKAAAEKGEYPFTYVESILEHEFLKDRTPEINMNSVFILKPDVIKGVPKEAGKEQAAVAARAVYAIARYIQEIKSQGLAVPERVTQLLSQHPKEKLLTITDIFNAGLQEECIDLSPLHHEFGRSLIPSAESDEIHLTPLEQLDHIIVLHDGYPYYVQVMDPEDTNRVLPLEAIQQSLHHILSITPESDNTAPVSVLTAASRSLWAKAYTELTKGEENKENKAILEQFHSAMLVVCLDSKRWSDNSNLAEASALHGSKEELENRWYDKNQLIVSADGRLAFNFETSCSDRVHWSYWIERVLQLANDKEGAGGSSSLKELPPVNAKHVRPLEITFGKSFAAHIRNARLEAHHIVEDLEVHSVHIPFGKENIALLNPPGTPPASMITPDAFAQVVLQLAHDTLRDRLTAASQLCSVANHFHGLTAIARTMTPELAEVIRLLNEIERKALPILQAEHDRKETQSSQLMHGDRPMAVQSESPKALLASHVTSTEDKLKLTAALRKAIQSHQIQTLRAAKGEGIDRHLTVLHHYAERNGDKAGLTFFEDELHQLSHRYLLSTSSFSREWLQYYTFGPEQENGYGLGYVVDAKEMRVSLTALVNSPATNVADLTSAILFYSEMVYKLLLEGVEATTTAGAAGKVGGEGTK